MRLLASIALILAGAAIAANAADDPARLAAGDEHISVEDWKDRVLGRTVYYFIEGEFFGREFYSPDGISARFQHVSGACADGTWGYDEETRVYCFAWPTDVACFYHVMRDEEITIISASPDSDGERPQHVGTILDGGFTCEPGATS